MSENYRPDNRTDPGYVYGTAILSQRDLSLRVPINFVNSPGVSLMAACFANGIFEDDSAAVCLSNLLAVGFRRFELDLYWDHVRSLWTFCPVAINSTIVVATPLPTPTKIGTSSALLSTGLASLVTLSDLAARQEATSTSSGGSVLSASSLGQAIPTVAIIPNSPDAPLIQSGPYTCTSTINLSIFISLLLDYIQETQTNIDAHLIYVILNIHAAALASAPTSSAATPASYNLPTESSSLSASFTANLSSYIYTPANLRSDRENINSSWYTVEEQYRPVEDYYSTSRSPTNIASTEDGWPSTSYIEFSQKKRLLFGFGTVDPQMARYNFTQDESTIFPAGYIQDIRTDINVTSTDGISGGCFLRNDTNRVSSTNSSWASDANLTGFDYPTTLTSDITPLLNLTLNTTQCGINPILNITLLNTTANSNYSLYQNYTFATIWSWAPNEPRNYTDDLFRCATTNPDLQNRWTVNDCSQRYYAACRAYTQPYNWTITTYPISYSFADDACPSGYTFAAPRTSLENSYLGQVMRTSRRDYDGHGAWVDFNSLDVRSCWTSGGPNATCPYNQSVEQMDDLRKRVILVPTIAAIIVFVVTGMTIFVKIAGGKKARKRVRKRAENGFVYEGVPS